MKALGEEMLDKICDLSLAGTAPAWRDILNGSDDAWSYGNVTPRLSNWFKTGKDRVPKGRYGILAITIDALLGGRSDAGYLCNLRCCNGSLMGHHALLIAHELFFRQYGKDRMSMCEWSHGRNER
jgi:hypothetical protein